MLCNALHFHVLIDLGGGNHTHLEQAKGRAYNVPGVPEGAARVGASLETLHCLQVCDCSSKLSYSFEDLPHYWVDILLVSFLFDYSFNSVSLIPTISVPSAWVLYIAMVHLLSLFNNSLFEFLFLYFSFLFFQCSHFLYETIFVVDFILESHYQPILFLLLSIINFIFSFLSSFIFLS